MLNMVCAFLYLYASCIVHQCFKNFLLVHSPACALATSLLTSLCSLYISVQFLEKRSKTFEPTYLYTMEKVNKSFSLFFNFEFWAVEQLVFQFFVGEKINLFWLSFPHNLFHYMLMLVIKDVFYRGIYCCLKLLSLGII